MIVKFIKDYMRKDLRKCAVLNNMPVLVVKIRKIVPFNLILVINPRINLLYYQFIKDY